MLTWQSCSFSNCATSFGSMYSLQMKRLSVCGAAWRGKAKTKIKRIATKHREGLESPLNPQAGKPALRGLGRMLILFFLFIIAKSVFSAALQQRDDDCARNRSQHDQCRKRVDVGCDAALD